MVCQCAFSYREGPLCLRQKPKPVSRSCSKRGGFCVFTLGSASLMGRRQVIPEMERCARAVPAGRRPKNSLETRKLFRNYAVEVGSPKTTQLYVYPLRKTPEGLMSTSEIGFDGGSIVVSFLNRLNCVDEVSDRFLSCWSRSVDIARRYKDRN